MTTKTVYAVVAVIIVAIAAIGAAVLLSGGSNSIDGNYELAEGSVVILEGDDVKEQTLAETKLTIKSDGSGLISVDWDGSKKVGVLCSDGMIRFTSVKEWNGVTYYENGYGKMDGNVLFYTALVKNADSSITAAWAAVFVKEGTKWEPEGPVPSPLLKEGTVFESYKRTMMIDGKLSDSDVAYQMKVLSVYGPTVLLEHATANTSGGITTYKTLAIKTGDYTYESGFTKRTGSASILTDGELAFIYYDYSQDGKNISQKICMTSTEKGTGSYVPEDLSGKLYTGTCASVMVDGSKATTDMTISFGDAKDTILYAGEIYGGLAYMMQIQVAPDSVNGGYYLTWSEKYEVDGGTVVDFSRGHISAELKTMEVSIVSFSDQGGASVSKCVLNLVDVNSVFGTYDIVSMDSISGTESASYKFEEPYQFKLTIDAIYGDAAVGTYLGEDFIGTFSEGLYSGLMTFMLDDEYVAVRMYDGSCYIKTMGLDDGASFAHYFKCVKEGAKNIQEIPELTSIFSIGESFTAYDGFYVSSGECIPMESGQKLECIHSAKGLYAFKLTTSSGIEIILNGYGTNINVIRAAANYNGSLATYNIEKHSDSSVCVDREYMTGQDTIVLVLRMSADGKAVEVPAYPDLNGKTYRGIFTSFVLKDGKVTYYDWSEIDGFTLLFQFLENHDSVASVKSEGGIADMHMLLNGDGSLRKMEYYLAEDFYGTTYFVEYSAVFSENGEVVKISGFGVGSDGSRVAMFMDGCLATMSDSDIRIRSEN